MEFFSYFFIPFWDPDKLPSSDHLWPWPFLFPCFRPISGPYLCAQFLAIAYNHPSIFRVLILEPVFSWTLRSLFSVDMFTALIHHLHHMLWSILESRFLNVKHWPRPDECSFSGLAWHWPHLLVSITTYTYEHNLPVYTSHTVKISEPRLLLQKVHENLDRLNSCSIYIVLTILTVEFMTNFGIHMTTGLMSFRNKE